MIMTEKRFIRMRGSQILYLIFISGIYSFTVGSSDFHLIDLSKTYKEAKSYCREIYTDLATVHSSADMNNLITLVSTSTARAWIGLENGEVWIWHWSWPDQKLDFLNWREGEPQKKKQDACAAMDEHGKWFESNCGTKRSFVCHGNSETSHFFVADAKSWRDAQNHCRGLSSDLVSIHSVEENEAVHKVSVSQNVWIGLFKDPWKWSDGSNSSFRNWKAFQPNYRKNQDCVAAIFKDKGQWNDLKCGVKCNFVCHGARKYIPTTTDQTSIQETLTTDQLPKNTTLPNTVVASTKQPNTTNITTEEETTTAELTTQNTTNIGYSTSRAELSNATTEMSTLTATQLPPATTVQVTTDGISALTTLGETSAQNTTQFSTENSQRLPPGHLILIQQNMTWIEAMSYCREHHIDLVRITSKDIQETVADKAKNATSAYVWLGLRYTCNFSFWFWTSWTTGCYQNWAPGQGSEGIYDCGASGAIKATGRQQWVGLPETERLNFICYACAG